MTATDADLNIVEKLLELHDLEGLGDIGLLDLARNTRIEKYVAATLLRADEHTDRHLYLVAGKAIVKADGKVLQAIVAGTERARLPLFRVHTHGVVALCETAIELLSIDEEVFARHVALIRPNDSGVAVTEYEQANDEPEVVTEAKLDFTHSDVDLPSMPEAAMRVFEILQRDDCDIRHVADVIKLDPIIAVRVVQVANSVMYHAPVAVESIKDAITRIGINTTRAIVMSVVLKNLFKPKSELIHQLHKRFYHHSIRVAAIAYILAKHLKGFDADKALLAGLVHDIGVVPILVEADHNKKLLGNEAELNAILQKQAHTIGANLLSQWGFDDVFVAVARESEEWGREVGQADYCDLIQIAQLHCIMIGGKKIDAPPISEIPSFRRLGLEGIDPQALLKEAKHEIHEIVELLL